MQIVRTDVSRATALTGEPVLRVLFCGEGGDCVTVDMASIESANDGVALDRARAILVQTATFGLAANEYDARSNGNFDEVAVTRSLVAGTSGVYIFEYRDGEGSRQVPPSSDAKLRRGSRRSYALRDRSSGRLGAGNRRVDRVACARPQREWRIAVRHRRSRGRSCPPIETMNCENLLSGQWPDDCPGGTILVQRAGHDLVRSCRLQ